MNAKTTRQQKSRHSGETASKSKNEWESAFPLPSGRWFTLAGLLSVVIVALTIFTQADAQEPARKPSADNKQAAQNIQKTGEPGGLVVSVGRGDGKTNRERAVAFLTALDGVAALSPEQVDFEAPRQLFRQFPQETDWLLQDLDGQLRVILSPKTRVAAFGQLLDKASTELLLAERDALGKPHGDAVAIEVLAAYFLGCEMRRGHRLAALRQKTERIALIKGQALTPSFIGYTEAVSDAKSECNYRPGGGLYLLDMTGAEPALKELVTAGPEGAIRDLDVSDDGKRILFAHKKSLRGDDYHLYELTIETGEVRQLTSGERVADYEGIYLPDGNLMFSSTRCIQFVDCFGPPVSNLYLCDAQGQHIRRIGYDQVHTLYPQVLPDGRVIYTRWDYNDRGQIFTQPLFQMNPDGTGQTEYYGNNSYFPTSILHARGIPNTDKVLAVLSGHHTWQAGKVAVIDVKAGNQEGVGIQLVAPTRPAKPVRLDTYGQAGELFRYPYPLDASEFLACYNPLGTGKNDFTAHNAARPALRFSLYWFHMDGRRELLLHDPAISCAHPIPLAARSKPPVRASVVNPALDQGIYYLQDIYTGPGLAGVARGSISRLRVVALEFRPVTIGSNCNKGPAGGAIVVTPIAIANGSWDIKRIVGEATVYSDGSAMFKAPANTPLYFQAVDGKGYVAATMRSWSTLMPGETFGCVGCHEPKQQTPVHQHRVSAAMQAGVEDLKPFQGITEGFSYPKHIQPILDRRCAKCHDASNAKGGIDLSSQPQPDLRAKRSWARSYLTLTQAVPATFFNGEPYLGEPAGKYLNWVHPAAGPELQKPYAFGSSKAKLLELLEGGHGKACITRDELAVIAAWIDLAIPYCGAYDEANIWNADEQQMYEHYCAKRKRFATPPQQPPD